MVNGCKKDKEPAKPAAKQTASTPTVMTWIEATVLTKSKYNYKYNMNIRFYRNGVLMPNVGVQGNSTNITSAIFNDTIPVGVIIKIVVDTVVYLSEFQAGGDQQWYNAIQPLENKNLLKISGTENSVSNGVDLKINKANGYGSSNDPIYEIQDGSVFRYTTNVQLTYTLQ